MATREVIVGDLEGVDRFDDLSLEIEEKFYHFRSLLETQRISLLERVKKMRELYQEHQELSDAIEQLERIRRTTNEMLNANLVAEDKVEVTKIWDDKIEKLSQNKSNLETVSDLRLVVNSEELNDCVKRIHLREIGAVEYSKRREPLVMKGKRGDGDGEVIHPLGISIDDTNKEVFVADYDNTIYVYSFEGDFIRTFDNEHLNGPYGICISGEFLFVSNLDNSLISKFTKTGEFVKRTSLEGENAIQLKSPTGLCVHNELLYICNGNNNRIEVLKLDLTFVKNFGEDKLKYPEDIKLFNNEIFVLTQLGNTIHTFSSEHNYLRSINFVGQQNQIALAFFFTIDNKGNFIVCDLTAGSLKVFSPSGKYVETLGKGYLVLPRGVAMDNQQCIVVVNQSDYKCLQVY